MDQPFHPGELALQERAGVRAQMAPLGARMIRDHMPEQHRELFGKLPTLLVGSLDAARRPWASLLAGRPGFVHSPDPRRLRVEARPDDADPLAGQLAPDTRLGLLGLEPATRRRNRMNGRVIALDSAGFTVAVEQSFGNCPQYIQAREPAWVERAVPVAQRFAADLPDAGAALVRRADTLFIASAAPDDGAAGGADVSHRGGRPGFVRVRRRPGGGDRLSFPDFRGNNLFNTLGNLAAWPWAGLLFFDPASGDRLQLIGRATVEWDGADVAGFAGALRVVHVDVVDGVWSPAALPLRWSAAAEAPQLAATGTWPDLSDPSDSTAGGRPMEAPPGAT